MPSAKTLLTLNELSTWLTTELQKIPDAGSSEVTVQYALREPDADGCNWSDSVMADCCSSSECKTARPNKHRCPANGVEYTEVPARTIAHHIKHPWQWEGKGRRYFFCDDTDCDVVYFGDDDSVILKSELRTQVGVKELSEDVLLCYCFGVAKADALNDPGIRNFVVTQTKLGLCSCDTSNPSGRCCLKSFPRNSGTE